MEEQEEGRQCENEERKMIIQKMIPQTVISLRNYYDRTVQTADRKFWLACYLYSIDGVFPFPTLFTCTYFIFIFSMKTNTKSVWKLIYLYIFLPCLWSWGTKEKDRREKFYTHCPKKTEAGRKCGERKKKTRRPNEITKVQRLTRRLTHSRRSVVVLSPPPFLNALLLITWRPVWGPCFISPSLFCHIHLNTQLDTGTRFV